MLRGEIEINRVNWFLKGIFWHSYIICEMVRGWDKREKVELWILCVNEKVDESGQIRLLSFEENPGRRMRELWSSFFIEIIVFDVD